MSNSPKGSKAQASAVASFKAALRNNNGTERQNKCGVKASRAESLAFWNHFRQRNPNVTADEIRAMQRQLAAIRKKYKRGVDRSNGVSTTGYLLTAHSWRRLDFGDDDEGLWRKKLSFIPVVSVGSFGEENLAKLRLVHESLVEVVRLRGGGRKTTKHQTGKSLGRTVMSGGRVPDTLRQGNPAVTHVSGTIQLAKFADEGLQKEVTKVVTACVEEAFGKEGWYKAAKQCFAGVQVDRRLPESSLPASNIWWSWNSHKSQAHIDANAVPPCFVFCPYSYNGAELLCCDNRKIPLTAGRVVGGSWHRFPHCNDTLYGDEDRYSFVVYFDYRMLKRSFLTKL